MGKRQAKYNPAKHLTSVIRGHCLYYPGSGDTVYVTDRYGRECHPQVTAALSDKPWRWRVEITVHASAGDLERVHPVSFTTEQAHRINDLTEIVQDYRAEAVLSLPPAFSVDSIAWRATVV